jgi:hypothetical protein
MNMWKPGSAAAPMMLILVAGCDIPYRPEAQPQPFFEQESNGFVFSVNTNQQVCNPSIAENDAYPGSMLWLGFSQLSVKVPDGVTDYPLTRIEEHDRITVTDTSNTVRWSLMARAAAPTGEMQCPRWSAHPDYISFTMGIPAQPYSGYAVRVSDRKILKVCDAHLEEFSTPHAWIPDSLTSSVAVETPAYGADGLVSRDDVQLFFGTTRFKFVYAMPETQAGALFFVDYSAPGTPAPVRLPKPAGRESWHCESPQVSRDGGWVAYHCFQNAVPGYGYATYMQKLQAGALPILVSDRASDPHWWVDSASGANHLVYSVTRGDYFTDADFTDTVLQAGGTVGATVRRRLAGNAANALALDAAAKPDTLVRLPFKGGLSRDGKYLCTAYKYAYLMRIQ